MKKQHKVKPITPDEVTSGRKIPDEVITAFNTLIEKNWNGAQAYIEQEVVVREILRNFEKSNVTIERDEIFDNHYLDIESLFCIVGWEVSHDNPGWDSTSKPYFTFRIKF